MGHPAGLAERAVAMAKVAPDDEYVGLADPSLLGKAAPNLSPSVIARLRDTWQADYARWQRRDLAARRYVYIWADGIYLQARMEPQAECMLVLIGATPEGKKELLGFQVGLRESAQSWRELLVDLNAHIDRDVGLRQSKALELYA